MCSLFCEALPLNLRNEYLWPFCSATGHQEDITVENVRKHRLQVLQVLKDIASRSPETTTDEEIMGDSYTALLEYEDTLQDYWSRKALIVANRGSKIWTFWNAVFYCGTIYTTIGKFPIILLYCFTYEIV